MKDKPSHLSYHPAKVWPGQDLQDEATEAHQQALQLLHKAMIAIYPESPLGREITSYLAANYPDRYTKGCKSPDMSQIRY